MPVNHTAVFKVDCKIILAVVTTVWDIPLPLRTDDSHNKQFKLCIGLKQPNRLCGESPPIQS